MKRLAIALALLLPLSARAQAPQPVTLFAAASLTDALTEIGQAWAATGQPAPRLSFASSSTLARQIEAGAPAAIFASADARWMDELAHRELIVADSRIDLLGNDLVVVGPAGAAPMPVSASADWLALLRGRLGADGRIATGDPAHVPAGIYAQQALTRLGAWTALKGRIAAAEDVRNALLLVERGEAPLGIVYATDAAVSRAVVVVARFPADSHDPVVYPFALLRGQDSPAARALFGFITGPTGRAIFAARGFRAVSP